MTRRRLLALSALIAVAVALGWLLFFALPKWYGEQPVQTAAPAPQTVEAARRIKATLFFVSEDGLRLVAMEREVPFGEGTVEQARRIVEEQLKPPPQPLTSAMPSGTRLHALYVTERGDAFVDLSREVVSAHTGGSLDELFTVYALVNALTLNLPAVTAVQILIDGKEVETLAGHVDLRNPLRKNLKWVEEPTS